MALFLTTNAGLLVGLIIILGGFLAQNLSKKRGPYPLPPGPPAEPILGHFRKIPALSPEHKYIEWGRQYCKPSTTSESCTRREALTNNPRIKASDILYLNVLGRPIIVINSAKVAHDLLDKRGANYASRPRFVLYRTHFLTFRSNSSCLPSPISVTCCFTENKLTILLGLKLWAGELP
jgi:hypothetical protein